MINIYKDVAEEFIKGAEENKSKISVWLDEALDWIVEKGVYVLLTLLFIYIGSKVIKVVLKIIHKSFDRHKLSASVSGFLISFIRIILYILLFISAASLLGFQVTSFVTILGASGIAIGLALQGSLSNLAGGVLILILKPFDVGDYIIENHTKCEGTVIGIDVFYTKLRTVDNRVVVIPNGNLSNTSIINVTKLGERMVEIKIGVSYKSDMKTVKDILIKTALDNELTLKDKGAVSFVDEFMDSAVKFGVRFWVKSPDFHTARWAVTEEIKKQFDENGVVIPFNQLEVTINN